MKKSKIGKFAALLAAGALLFNGFFMSCSSDDDGGSSGSNENNSEDSSTDSSISGFEAPSISGSYFPADGAADAYADTDLIIAFDSAPTVSDSAVVTIKSGDTVVDTINAVDETLVSGNGNGTIGEIGVRKQLMRVVDNYLIIKTHNDSSAYGLLSDSTLYTVSVSGVSGAINKASVSEVSWSFTTKSAPSIFGSEISAGHNGTEDFYSVQGALNYVRKNSSAGDSYKINVSEGCYYERLFYNGSADITISGDASDADNARGAKTRFYWNNFEGLISGQSGARARAAFFFNGGANVNLRYLTMQNMADRSTDVKNGNAQAEALAADISGNLTAYQCSFASHQDTLYIGAKGNRSWFYDCYIEGDTDYIWGYGDVALVEKCDLRCIRDTYVKKDQKSYIFAARTYETQEVNKGFVLLDSKVTIDSGVTAYYGRNSGADTQATVMNNVFSGSGTLASVLWGSSAGTTLDVAGDPAIAYKDYLNYFDSTLVDVSGRQANTFGLGERVAKREYNGRYAILNRGYDKTNEVYATSSTIWDISEYEDEFSAEEDTSSSNVYVNPVYSKNIVGGNTVQLTASSDASDITYTYSSDNESLATVDDNGLVTTIVGASGTATITVTGSNGSTDTASVKVIPEDISATAVSISLADSTVAKYGLTTATVSFEPTDTTDKTYTLTSDNENVLFYDTSSLKLASSVTTTDESVRIWVGADVSNATITAASATYESAASGTAAISASDTVAEWTAEAGSYRMKTDIQSGNAGLWDGLVIDSKADGTIITANGKMSLKSSDRMQTRNVVLYIPVEGASTVVISTTAAPNCTYSVGSGTSQPFEVSDTTQTYTYDGSKDGIVLGSSISSLSFYKTAGDSVSANGKYLKVNVIKTSSDDYITSITATKTGDFTATWDEQEEATGASGTYSFSGVTVTDYVYTSSDGFVVATGLEQDENGHGLAASADDTITISVSGMSKITLLGCKYGNGAPCTVSDGTNTLATYSSTNVSTDGDEVSPSSYYLTESTGTVTVTFTGAGWIHGVKVESLESFTSVASISVTDSDGATSSTISVGDSVSLTAAVSPSDATETSVSWSSSDESIASVSSGNVTGVSAGTATITATALDGSGVAGTYEVTVEASTATVEKNQVYTWNFVGLSSAPSVKSDNEGNGINLTIDGNPSNNAGYGLYGSEATYTFPVAGDAIVIAYVTYINGSGTLSLTTSDGTAVGTDKSITKSDAYLYGANDHKPANGPVAYAWRYVGSATELTLNVPASLYLGQIVSDSTEVTEELTACNYDFTDSAIATPLAPSAGNNKIHWYGTECGAYKSSSYGIQAVGPVYFTFYVGGACTFIVNTSYEQGTGNFMLRNETCEVIDEDIASTGDRSANAREFSISEAGVYTFAMPKNTYVKSISIQ